MTNEQLFGIINTTNICSMEVFVMERNYTYSHRARQERLELRRKQAFRRRVRTLSTVFVFVFIFISEKCKTQKGNLKTENK